MKADATREKIAGHWIGKTTAGCVCGFLLAIAMSGLLARLAPGSSGDAGKAEVAMLSVSVIWTAVFAAAYAFRTGVRAWAWLGAASLVAFVLFEMSGFYA